jgi:hypothetical protein
MQIFVDESGSFRRRPSLQTELAHVMGVIIPDSESHSLEGDFYRFLINLPKDVFANGEPKGSRLSPEQVKRFASMLNRHRGVTLAPVTVNTTLIEASFFKTFPQRLRSVLEENAVKCESDALRSKIVKLASRCGNLSPEQLVRLKAYAVAILRSIQAVSLFYRCQKYHSDYSPIKVVLDRAGPANGREELVFKELLFMWGSRMSEASPIKGIKRIHTESHPLVRLYGAKVNGAVLLDVSRMLRGNIEFGNSRESWQLQFADMATSAWAKALFDRRNKGGYLPAFSLLHRNTILPQDQPMGMVSVAEAYSETEAPPEFGIFRELAQVGGKLLPCGWDEV